MSYWLSVIYLSTTYNNIFTFIKSFFIQLIVYISYFYFLIKSNYSEQSVRAMCAPLLSSYAFRIRALWTAYDSPCKCINLPRLSSRSIIADVIWSSPCTESHLPNSRLVVIATDCRVQASTNTLNSSCMSSASWGRKPGSSMTSRAGSPHDLRVPPCPAYPRPLRSAGA